MDVVSGHSLCMETLGLTHGEILRLVMLPRHMHFCYCFHGYELSFRFKADLAARGDRKSTLESVKRITYHNHALLAN